MIATALLDSKTTELKLEHWQKAPLTISVTDAGMVIPVNDVAW